MKIRTLQRSVATEQGFTLIELLVVMLIIGILAAIALPSFFNQKDKANDAKAKEYAHTAQVAMETCATTSGGSYDPTNCGTAAKLAGIEGTLGSIPAGNLVVSATGTAYTVTVKSTPTTQTFGISRAADGTLTFPCSVAGKGGCPTGGWGG